MVPFGTTSQPKSKHHPTNTTCTTITMQLMILIAVIIQTFLLVMPNFHNILIVSAMDADGCYEKGTIWNELGTWDDIEKALDGDPIYNTGYLDKGSDPVSRK